MIDILTAAPKEIRFGDRTLRVGALKLRELGLLQRWIREHAEKPGDRLRRELELLPEEDHADARRAAARAERPESWPPAIGSAEGNRILLSHEDGQHYFLQVMLTKYQPLDPDELDALAAGLSDDHFGMLVRIAFGGDDLDPSEALTQARDAIRELREAMLQFVAASTTSPGPISSAS
jgi:hypothetical protein